MKENAVFEKSLKLSKISLLMSGISIYQKDWNTNVKFLLNCLFYFNFLWLYTDALGEFYWLIEGIIVGKSFSELTFMAPCTTICLLATAKSTPIYYNRKLLVKVVNKLREIHPNTDNEDNTEIKTDEIVTISYKLDDKNDIFDISKDITENNEKELRTYKEMEKKILKDSITFLNRTTTLNISACFIVVVLFSLQPILTMIYEYNAKGETDLRYPFFIKYFFDPFTKSRWPFVYFHQIWSTLITGYNIFGADSFLYVFCTYTKMHFRILSHHFEHAITCSHKETRERLSKLVKRHQELIELVDQMEALYSKSTLFHIISSSVLICLSGFNVTVMDDKGAIISFALFLFMSLAHIFLLCFFGDMLMNSSTEVSDAIYKSRWYDTDASTKRSLLIILLRAQKPCRLTAFKFANLNLTVFTMILSRSWSYFALLRTMYN